MSQLLYPSTAMTSSIISQSPTAPTNDSNHNSFIICRVQFLTLLNNDHHPNDDHRSPSVDYLAPLQSNYHTSPMDVPAPFEMDNEPTHLLIVHLFSVSITVDEIPTPKLRDPLLMVLFEHISHTHKKIIQTALLIVFPVLNPREFQFVGAHHCAFKYDTYLAVIHCTADGKSLIPQIVGVLRRAVCIYLVLLISLGSNQVEQATIIEHNLELYHIDEHKNKDAWLLISRLENMTKEEMKHVTIKLFLLPNAMTSTKWGTVLVKLAKRGLISFFCIDEDHDVDQSGRHFRSEIKKAVKVTLQLIRLMP